MIARSSIGATIRGELCFNFNLPLFSCFCLKLNIYVLHIMILNFPRFRFPFIMYLHCFLYVIIFPPFFFSYIFFSKPDFRKPPVPKKKKNK